MQVIGDRRHQPGDRIHLTHEGFDIAAYTKEPARPGQQYTSNRVIRCTCFHGLQKILAKFQAEGISEFWSVQSDYPDTICFFDEN